MTAPIDYNAVLADLEAKRGQIDAAIAVIRSLIGSAGGDPPATTNGVASGGEGVTPNPAATAQARSGQPLQTDTFFRLSTSEAVRKYLGMMKRPQTPRAIADALQQGGQVHAADGKAAYTNVYTALKRGKDFAQTRNGEWGLAEWYSGKQKDSVE